MDQTARPERDTEVAMGRKGHLGDLAPNPDRKNPAGIGFVTTMGEKVKP